MSHSQPATYSPAQIALHWAVAALVLFQLVFGESIKDLGRALRRGETPDATVGLMGNLHIWVGFTVLALVVLRILLRLSRGAPAAPEGEPAVAVLVMKVAHALFYLLLVAAPVTGAVAWYLYPPVGEVHEVMKPAFVVLIALHVAAVLWHHFIRRDDVMSRMLTPRP